MRPLGQPVPFLQIQALHSLQTQFAQGCWPIPSWLQIDQIEQRLFRRGDERVLSAPQVAPPVAVEQVHFDVPESIGPQRRLPPAWSRRGHAGGLGDVLVKKAIVGQGGLEADV